MPVSKTQSKAKANAKYVKKIYEKASLVVRRDAEINGEYIRLYAVSKGESMNGFIMRAIKETIERDKAKMRF